MKYKANYNTNGTCFAKAINDTNKARIIKDIREIAEGNAGYKGNCAWWVEDETGKEIAAGGLANGVRYRRI